MRCRPRACGKRSGNDVVLSATTTRPRAKAKRSMNSLRGSRDSDSSVIRQPTPPATADWMRCILTRNPLNLGPKAFLTTGTPRSGTRFERSAPVTLGRPKVCDRGGTLVREALAVGRGQVDRAGDRLRVGSAIRYVSARCHGQHDCEKQCRRLGNARAPHRRKCSHDSGWFRDLFGGPPWHRAAASDEGGVPAQNRYQHGWAGTLDGAVAGAKNGVVMAQATKLGFCGSCRSQVPAARNPHRVRNTTAANFAAANLSPLASPDFSAFGATGPYVCPYCGGDVKVSSKGRRPFDPGARPGRP
jgi:hypothetical protein